MADISEDYAIGLNEVSLANEMPEVERMVTLATAHKYPLAAAAREQGKPANSEFAWGGYKQPDQAALPVLDGTRTTPDSFEQATKLWSLTEEIRKNWKMTRRTEAVKDYFGDATVARQMMYALQNLQKAKENIFGSLQTPRPESGTLGQRTRGLLEMLLPTTVAVVGGDTWQPFPAIARMRADSYFGGALANFDLDAFRALLQSVATYHEGDVNLIGFVGPALKAKMTSFVWYDQVNSGTKPNVINYRRGDKAEPVALYVDVFKTDFGEVRVATDYHLAIDTATGAATDFTPNAGVFIDPGYLFTRTLQPLRHTPAEEQGQGKGGFYSVDVGLAYRFPAKAALVLPGAGTSVTPPDPETDGPASAGVTSVNGRSGAVTLTASDLGALPTTGGTLTGALTIADGTATRGMRDSSTASSVTIENTGIAIVSGTEMRGDIGASQIKFVNGRSEAELYASSGNAGLKATDQGSGYCFGYTGAIPVTPGT